MSDLDAPLDRKGLLELRKKLEVPDCDHWRSHLEAIKVGDEKVRAGDAVCACVRNAAHQFSLRRWGRWLWEHWPRDYCARPLAKRPKVCQDLPHRIEVLRKRWARGVALFHPGDTIDFEDVLAREGILKGQLVTDCEANRPWEFARGQARRPGKKSRAPKEYHCELPDHD